MAHIEMECTWCGRRSPSPLRYCTGCAVARYCDEDCQRQDFVLHRHLCLHLRSRSEESIRRLDASDTTHAAGSRGDRTLPRSTTAIDDLVSRIGGRAPVSCEDCGERLALALQVVETVRTCESPVTVRTAHTGASATTAAAARRDGEDSSAAAEVQDQGPAIQMWVSLRDSIVVDAVLVDAPSALALVIHTRSGHSRVCFLSRTTTAVGTGEEGPGGASEATSAAEAAAGRANRRACARNEAPAHEAAPPAEPSRGAGVRDTDGDGSAPSEDGGEDGAAAQLARQSRQLLSQLAGSVPWSRPRQIAIIRSTSEFSARLLSQAAAVFGTPVFSVPSHHHAYEADVLGTLSHATSSVGHDGDGADGEDARGRERSDLQQGDAPQHAEAGAPATGTDCLSPAVADSPAP